MLCVVEGKSEQMSLESDTTDTTGAAEGRVSFYSQNLIQEGWFLKMHYLFNTIYTECITCSVLQLLTIFYQYWSYMTYTSEKKKLLTHQQTWLTKLIIKSLFRNMREFSIQEDVGYVSVSLLYNIHCFDILVYFLCKPLYTFECLLCTFLATWYIKVNVGGRLCYAGSR